MLTVKVLGPGCAKCEYLEQRARLALADIKTEFPDVEAVVEKVTDMNVFMEYGLMMTPGLVINDKLVSAGRIVAPDTIADWMHEALNNST
ncbi:MAG: thioredoxin family protein [Anaerolineales bacterium]|nr:thioredoxin family protein [Anaerolineales bacterium]